MQQIATVLPDNNAPDDSVCAKFSFMGTGYIAFFDHKERPESADADDDH